MRGSGVKPIEWIARAYIFVFRGAPLLVQLFVVYYGLSSFPVGAREHLLAVPARRLQLRDAVAARSARRPIRARSSAARSPACRTVRSRRRAPAACRAVLLFRRVIFPIALRQALPAYSTEVISMVKATALVSLVTLWDVMSVALKIRNDTLVTYTPLLIAGAIYFVVNYLIARAFIFIEQWLSPHLRARSA